MGQQRQEIEGFSCDRIKERRLMCVSIDRVGSGSFLGRNGVHRAIAPISKDEVSRLHLQISRHREIVLAVGIDGEGEKPSGQQVIGALNPRIADGGVRIADARKYLKEAPGELNHRTVLHHNPGESP